MIEPRKRTKERAYLDFFKQGGAITKAEAINHCSELFRTVSLNTIVNNLRKKGWDIKAEMIERDNAQSYARYYLSSGGMNEQ